MASEFDKWGWEHVTVFGVFDRGSGTKRWKCNHCNLRYNGSYSRVRAHLLRFSGVGVKSCLAINRTLREAFHILEEERLARKKKRTFGSGKPTFGCGYEPPSMDKLSDCFLSKEKGRIEKSITLVRESWPHTGYTVLCVGCLGCGHKALQDVVVSEEWKQWKHSILKDILIIEASILGDEFWSNAHMMLQLFKPFAKLLAMLDIDKSVMGAIYDWRVQALEVVRSKEIDETALNQLEVLIENKWNVLFSLLHAAGYILNPGYFGKARWVLRKQLSSYWRLEGSFGEEDALDCRDKMDLVAWWENFGFETPHLQTLAIKVLSQVSTISMCQDIWQDCKRLAVIIYILHGGVKMKKEMDFHPHPHHQFEDPILGNCPPNLTPSM
ncbi:Uncharacterized protein TCM_039722 [Theobroma cacao]|uniref:BED-type domain-containing protein n=1 Tax=Theobroma cacao TaxID=3641 RepID=A0A061GS13_THECC|nr:Uncharacterized protein TCM_039722 [Theobroma cacao]